MMNQTKPLIIFEMANNHGGSLEHGLNIIESIHDVATGFDFDFAFKFQYRSKNYIHPSYREKEDPPYVKRFESTRLTSGQYDKMIERVRLLGWKTICTPFDELSVDLIDIQNFNYIKIASCSFTDWPLLERIAKANMPVIASTAGAPLDDIDRVVMFFENRGIELSLMHCVAEYPTRGDHLELNQIDVLRSRYPALRIGLSSHEPGEHVMSSQRIALAKGATILERHVDIQTPGPQGWQVNAYSMCPDQIAAWLFNIKSTLEYLGVANQRHQSTEKEQADLRKFRRGVYATRDILEGETLDETNTVCAYPNIDGQLVANDLSKYVKYTAKSLIVSGVPIIAGNLDVSDTRPLVVEAINKVRELLIAANVKLPDGCDMELSHHYGLKRFSEVGCAIFTVINREYGKKIIVVLPGQYNPFHHHELKEETFNVLYGDMYVEIDEPPINGTLVNPGRLITIERRQSHAFDAGHSEDGCIFEEISTTHYPNDSYYKNADQFVKDRKTRLKFRASWLERSVV